MKSIKITILLLLISVGVTSAQNINWSTLKLNEKHLLNVNAGIEYATVFNAGYGYKLPAKLPIILNVEYGQPAGKKLDDMKSKIGGQVLIYRYKNFGFSAKVQGVFRVYNNPMVRLTNFGSDISGIIGHYRPRWFAAVEVGFDKAIVTKFKHKAEYREAYPQVVDGWYQPATGGNFYTGVIAGMSFGRTDVYLNAARVATEDFRGEPFLPFFGKVGATYKFGK